MLSNRLLSTYIYKPKTYKQDKFIHARLPKGDTLLPKQSEPYMYQNTHQNTSKLIQTKCTMRKTGYSEK